MIKAIFYKEWIKLRFFYPVCALVLLGFTAYSVFRIGRVIDFRGVGHIWEAMLEKESILIDMLQYLPVMAGLMLAIVQFVPEITQKRLKLTLHLPYPQKKMILAMLGIGITALLIVFMAQTAIVAGYFHRILVPELTCRILLTSMPWYLAGLSAYSATAWICMEPTWKWRIAEALISVGVCRIFFLSSIPQAYDGMLVWLCVIAGLMMLMPLYSVWRFRQGCQD